MPKTTNLELELTTDNSITFKSWREIQNGQGQGTPSSPLSNAQIIDNFAGTVQEDINDIYNLIGDVESLLSNI